MSNIRVHRFAAGNDQHQCAQDNERIEQARVLEIFQAVYGIKCRQNFWLMIDLPDAEYGNDDKPNHEDWTEYDSDLRRALKLDSEQCGQ